VGADVEPAGVPQRWQKRAPGVSGAEQVAHVAPASAVPQVEQKRPDAGLPHEGHGFTVASDVAAAEGLVGVVMEGKVIV
jgi:hypothetical protein